MLEMGEAVRIRDLAENMVLLAGLSVKDANNPDGDIEIVTVGIRDGEKLHEELFYDPQGVSATRHPKFCGHSAALTGWIICPAQLMSCAA